ncbi:FAD-dependent oxidoreductase [Streptomyces sp. NPDC059866]|uniref:FAD-dependent oxidoreductase n=1 Tax=Streptomyces sp. NPDC059866 TaxID=3346978 RepID=UPI003646CDFE
MYDVLSVGAGAAGLATAYRLRGSGLRVGVFDAADEVGGRTRSVEAGGLTVNTGAMFVYRDTPAEELAAELGIRTEPFRPRTYGIHVNGRTIVDSRRAGCRSGSRCPDGDRSRACRRGTAALVRRGRPGPLALGGARGCRRSRRPRAVYQQPRSRAGTLATPPRPSAGPCTGHHSIHRRPDPRDPGLSPMPDQATAAVDQPQMTEFNAA